MELIPPLKTKRPERDRSGIALFMVIAAISVLSILVTEFTYIAQINERMAFDSLDQIKAHYLAKSGLKISLLRLKAYQQVKSMLGGTASSNPLAGAVPKGLVEKIWNFPFFFPIPALPGMTNADKENLDKFQKDTAFDGKFVATIESESSKFNLNSLLPGFTAPAPSSSPSNTPTTPPSGAPPPVPSPSSSFSSDEARQSLQDYLTQLIANKSLDDEGFSYQYRDFKVDELMTNIVAWCDRTFKGEAPDYKDILPKGAPFYSVTELHMIPTMDDQLYDLFSSNLTASDTPGIDINTMQDATLRAILPQITADESKDFFAFRDSTEADNLFKKEQDFWDYVTAHISAFRNDKNQVDQYRQTLQKRGLKLVVDEVLFKITVQATANQATRTIEAWVTLSSNPTNPTTGGANPAASPSPSPTPSPQSSNGNLSGPPPDAGLKITFMRIL